MKKQIDWLPPGTSDGTFACGDMMYRLDELRAKFEVRDLPHGGHLVLNRKSDSNWMAFAVMAFGRSDVSGANTMVTCVFYGEGPGGKSDSLRECRHTYWGDDGYIFYPNGDIITDALAELREFFDLD